MGGSKYDGPDPTLVDAICVKVHDAWMEAEKAQSEKASDEKMMVPFEQLGDEPKGVYRTGVVVTLRGIEAAGYVVSKKGA